MKTPILAVFLLAFSAQAQGQLPARPAAIIHGTPPGRPAASIQLPSDTLTRIIVEFTEDPLFVASPRRRVPSFHQERFGRFASDLSRRAIRSSIPGGSVNAFRRTFSRVFFGVSMSVRSSQIAGILSLPYVKSVHIDRPVTATVVRSGARIGVPQVWQTYGNHGEGVRVGIIDSGIDYLHPALGAGFGQGFKVAGGYDFVNQDPDPRDDNGHGTHVAGIVAADAAFLRGIAPKATLYAYKVLDERGSGYESDVVAAIEATVDPNGDDDPSDHLDVVNLSLGTNRGVPTDPSAVAVDNASKLGVLFCIAAGNSGYEQTGGENNYYTNGSATIGSPGTAVSAITVGAVDSLDDLARFSSKGPNRNTFGIKPDLVAPGVAILSTILNGGYTRFNGTSMATPMVTGVAALLKAIHPDWSNERIRSALVNFALDIGLTAYRQGGGRVQAFAAANSTAWIRPTLLSFGLDNPSVSTTWTRVDTLMLYNSSSSPQLFDVAVSGLQPGISLTVSPSSIGVLANDSVMVFVYLSVNNQMIPVVNQDIPLYTGIVRFAGTTDTLSVPWAFARARRLRLTFDEPYPMFLLFGGLEYFVSTIHKPHWITPTTAELYGISPGTFEFLTIFAPESESPKVVIKEQQQILQDASTVTMSSSDATVPLLYQGVDHTGQPISSYPNARRVLVTSLPLFGDWVTLFRPNADTIRISPVSTNYVFYPLEVQFDALFQKSFHLVQHPPFAGITDQSPRTFSNNPADFISQDFVLRFPPGTSEAIVIGVFNTYREVGGEGYLYGMTGEVDTPLVVNGELVLNGYFDPSENAETDAAVSLYTIHTNLSEPFLDMTTFPIMISQDSILAITRDDASTTTLRSPSGGRMTFGGSPIHLLGLWRNNVFASSTLHFEAIFRGMQREQRYRDVNFGTYSVYDGTGNLLFSSPLNDYPRTPRSLAPGWYTVTMNSSNYWLRNVRGRVDLNSRFDLAADTAANPPTITSFQILNEQGQPTDSLSSGGTGSLLFSSLLINFSGVMLPAPDSTRVWYRIHGTGEWLPLTVEHIVSDSLREGAVFRSDLTPALAVDSVGVDIRILVKDSRDFSADFQATPVFAVGNWGYDWPTRNPGSLVPPAVFSLRQNYPNPFNGISTISFDIAGRDRVTMRIYDMLGRQVQTLIDEVLDPGSHRVRWDAGKLASGVYLIRLTSGSFAATRRAVFVK